MLPDIQHAYICGVFVVFTFYLPPPSFVFFLLLLLLLFLLLFLLPFLLLLRAGSTFKIVLDFISKNGTGTGEINLIINTVDGIPLGDAELMDNLAPGSYSMSWKVDAKRNPNCDPTQGPCEEWLAGNYTVNIGKELFNCVALFRI